MDTDEQTPLLRYEPPNRYRRAAAKLCSVQSWRKRVPITIWLPNYKLEYLFRDMIAGITVGLTSIPQGIAYALVAGLPPQVGLYSSIFPGVVYAIFGSCKDVTVGPTAILAALLTKYVAQSADFAYLAAFLSGCIILLLGVLQLGFLLDFISKPVISGFTTAAALQISASQLKSLFRVQGSSGSNVIEALINFFKNIKTIHLWDSILGVTTIVVLLLLKRISVPVSPPSSTVRVCVSRVFVYVVRARNALLVFGAAILAYCLHLYGYTPFALTGTIQGGLPHFSLPPFSTTVNNRTVNFEGMLSVFGVEGLVMPLVAILESIAIARAFAGSKSVDATQEMLAVGLCNALAACCGCMPATGSFTRTALNHASGVATPAGALFKASLVLLSVTLLSSAFYFIPRSTLAAVIIVAMTSIFDLHTIVKLWRHSRWELSVLLLTVGVGACCGLEYGILGGALADLLRHAAAHHAPNVQLLQIGNTDCSVITFVGTLKYASCARVFRELRRVRTQVVVIDGRYITHIDIGLTESIISAIEELEENGQKCLMWNFSDDQRLLFEDIHSDIATKFVSGPSIDQHILSLEVTR